MEGLKLFKKSEPEPKVEWITKTPGLVETWPVIPARQALPDWFKQSDRRIAKDTAHGHGMGMKPGEKGPQGPMMGGPPPPYAHGHGPQESDEPKPKGKVVGPKSYWHEESPTIRHCPGVVDVMRSGYLLRAWTDIMIETPAPPKRDGTDQFIDRTGMRPDEVGGKIGAFGPGLNQKIPLWEGEYEFALKFDSPWICKTPPGYSLLYSPIPYDEDKPYRVLHGITDNDSFHIVNILIMWKHFGTYVIEAGTPLCWLLPIKREGYNFPTEVKYDPDRYDILHAVGKGGIGTGGGGRLIHGSYIIERAKARKARGEKTL